MTRLELLQQIANGTDLQRARRAGSAIWKLRNRERQRKFRERKQAEWRAFKEKKLVK